jgi:dihydrofolate reductase/thymidylate synthase
MFYKNEEGYIVLLKDALKGETKNTRNGEVLSQFGHMIEFDNISKSFPLITTKKVFFRGIVEELLWFLRGSTNANELKDKKVNIWNGNSSRGYLDSIGLSNYTEGELGPVYGWQWRKFGKQYIASKEQKVACDIDNNFNFIEKPDYINRGYDQLKFVLTELLKDNNSRRAVLSAWNPCDLNKMALPPCHILYIFNKTNEGLCCHLTLRSSDLFLGLPFNIASCALLTIIIAHVLHINVSKICLSICDAHIYIEHIEQVKKQIELEIYNPPKVVINKSPPHIDSSIEEKIEWIEQLSYEDFELINYKSHDRLNALMK